MVGAESGYMGDAIAQSKDDPAPPSPTTTNLFRTMSALKVWRRSTLESLKEIADGGWW